MERMSVDEQHRVIDELEECEVPFRKFWELGDIYFDDKIPTACVSMHGDKIAMRFNPEFWEELPRKAQLFIVCHEQMHLLLDHFRRLKFKEGNAQLKNIAADVAVNHFLVRNYLFEKEDLPKWETYCWVETVFPKSSISDNETALYYYRMLRMEQEKSDGEGESGEGSPQSMDDHGQMELPPSITKQLSDIINDYVDEQTEGMSEDEKDEWIEDFGEELEDVMVSYDTQGMGNRQQSHVVKVTADNNWKSVYKNIPKKLFKIKNNSHWISRQRNHMLLPDSLMLPSTIETSEADKVRVHVYLDSSGSCINHAKHFLISSLTLPKSMFEVTYFGFGTVVYDIDPTPPYNLKGFGNESYQAVSDHLDKYGKRIDAVLVFTDGYSQTPIIKQAEKWHWFITPGGVKHMLPPGCNVYDLNKLHWTGQ